MTKSEEKSFLSRVFFMSFFGVLLVYYHDLCLQPVFFSKYAQSEDSISNNFTSKFFLGDPGGS